MTTIRNPATLREFAIACDLLARVRQPDLIVLLDLPVNASPQRLALQTDQPHQGDEGEEPLTQVRDTYLRLARGRADVIVVDADRAPDAVHADVVDHVAARFGHMTQ